MAGAARRRARGRGSRATSQTPETPNDPTLGLADVQQAARMQPSMPDEPALQTVTRGSERAGASHPGRTLSEVDEDQDEEEGGLEPPLERTTPSSRPALSDLGAGAPLGNEDLRAAVEQKRLEV